MKIFYLLFLTIAIATSASAQWRKVEQLPARDFYNIAYANGTLYAGGSNRVYTSINDGLTWDSSAIISADIPSVDDFIIFENNWFVGTYGSGVYKSANLGRSWQNITTGIDSYINEFCIFKGHLYASTDNGGVYQLAENKTSWRPFMNGFTWTTSSSIASNGALMVASGGANGSIFKYHESAGQWQEHLVKGQLAPGMNVSDIVSVNDTLYAATSAGVYSSTNGENWTNTGQLKNGHHVVMANLRQAIFAIVNYGLGDVTIYKKPKEAQPMQPWEIIEQHQNSFVYETAVSQKNLWQARLDGLYFRPLIEYGVTPPWDEPTPDIQFKIGKFFPNPTKQKFQVEIQVKEDITTSLFITNAAGQIVHYPFLQKPLKKGANLLTIDNPLPAGIYYVTIELEGKKYTRKLVVI
ncbi:T9SS type A sorting domain-containing protein [Aridibaculum aurantiacum]|uniref:T9SS type A sorting domain-containing protein n=1 Tax=Aridibaculum aurantiacum TaxID=2810307 RepID=UPI001A959713|nr:T9SS type A sorting domain-containing protein [Aridibaculum aurantiacum]